MPRVTDVYYNLLLKALTNGQYGPVELTEEAIEAALKNVNDQIQAMSPNPDDLSGSFNAFAQRQRRPEIYGRLRPDSDTIGPDNESRFNYAQRCRTEVMKSVKQRVLQELEWRNAAARLGLYDENHQLKQINPNRFLDRLMKTGGTVEDRQFNDAVMALAALANGDITEDKYLALRREHYITSANKSAEDAADLAQRDRKNGAELILREVEREIRDGSESQHRYQSAVAAIQSGNYSGFQNGMEEAFDILNNNAVELQMVGTEIFGFLNKLGLEHPSKARQEELRKDWLDRAFDVLQIREAAEQVANPYFALLDPFKLYRAFNAQNGGGFLPLDKDRQPQDALAYALLETGPEYQVTAGRALSRLGLRRCALDAGDEVLEERLPGFSVFHKDDRTLILKLGHANDNGIVSAEIDTSGEFFRQGLHEEAQALAERCNGWSKKRRTSPPFEDMRDALDNVAGMHLGEKPSAEEMILAGERFGELLWSAKAYLAHKLEQHPDQNWSGTYERERVEFANRVLEFAQKKLRHLDYLGEQKNTLAMRDAAERDMPGPLAPERNVPKYAGMSSLEYKLAKDKEKVQAQAQQQQQPPVEQQQQQAQQPQVQQVQPQVHAAKKDIAKDFGALMQNLAGASKDSAAAKEKIEVSIKGNDGFCVSFKRTIDTGKTLTGAKVTQADKDNLLQRVRQNAARRVVSELVSAEQEKQKQNPKAAVQVPFTQIVNAGKADQLAERIAESDAFKRLLGEYLHDDNIEIMPEFGNTKEFRAVCAQAGQAFFTEIMMGKLAQEHKAKQEQKAKQEEKEAVAAQNAPENQNRINIINEDEDDELEENFKEELQGVLSEAREVQSRISTTAGAAMKTHCIHAHTSFEHIKEIRAKEDTFGFKPKAAKTVLATETLQYMLTREGAGGVLANAVEKGQLSDLQNAIMSSDAFTESFKKFDWEKKIGKDWAAENQFCKQVGDALLRSAMPTLRKEAPLVAKQKAGEKNTIADSRHFKDSLNKMFDSLERRKKEDWVLEAAENGEEHPARDYLDRQIENESEKYEQLGEKGGEHLQASLAGLILAGMMADERTHGVFEAAVEYGMYPQLIEMIRTSPLFKATIGKLDPADTERVEKYVRKSEDYILPLGERIMQMSDEALKHARFQVLDKESARLYKEAFTEAEAARKAGTQPSEKVVERARESVALSAVFGLLSHDYDTNEHLSNEELRKIAYDSKEFKETLANRDLHDPTQIKEVCDWRPGHQFPKGFVIGGDIVSRMDKEKRLAEQQKRNEAQKEGKAKNNAQPQVGGGR